MLPPQLPCSGAHWVDHAAHPAVADIAVIGARHERWGETPIAVIVPADPEAPPSLEDLIAWSRDKLSSYKKPTGLVVIGELPRNASGKVLKHELRSRYGHPVAQDSPAAP
jgi:fatty-acyl-CoA synthase